MARSFHSILTAADRFERSERRRPRPQGRRTGTRSAVIRRALWEA